MILNLSDQELFELLSVLCVLLAGSYALYLIARRLKRSRQGLLLVAPVLAAFGMRFGAPVGLNQLSIVQDLRGGDELTLLAQKRDVAQLKAPSLILVSLWLA